MNTQTTESRLIKPLFRSRQTDDSVTLQIALPGAEKTQTTLTAKEGILIIEAPRTDLSDDTSTSYHLSLKISELLDTTQANASFELGVLNIVLPLKESAKPASISIN